MLINISVKSLNKRRFELIRWRDLLGIMEVCFRIINFKIYISKIIWFER